MSEHSGNFYLTLSQMQDNADILYGYIKSQTDWSDNPVFGMFGNMQSESTINPGIWQNLTVNINNGYGLVQWTPSYKYTDWCTANGYQADTLQTALRRIIWEWQNNQQWIATSYYNHNFDYYLHDTNLTPYQAALIFIRNYERPEDINQPWRGTQANYWAEYLTGHPPGPGPVYTGQKMPIYMMYQSTRRIL